MMTQQIQATVSGQRCSQWGFRGLKRQWLKYLNKKNKQLLLTIVFLFYSLCYFISFALFNSFIFLL